MVKDYSYLMGNQFAKGSKPNKTAFKKGDEPWNKDVKGIHLSPGTEFKKGQPSLRKLPLGTITQRKCKNGRQRNFIKIAEPKKWIKYAKYVWLSHYDIIIKGDVIHHLNGDSLNDNIDNLIAFPRAAHPVFHSKWGLKKPNREQMIYYFSRYKSYFKKDYDEMSYYQSSIKSEGK